MHIISPENFAPFFVRVLLGILFFGQGYEKVFRIKMKNVIDTIRPDYQKLKMPSFLIIAGAYITSYLELVGGFFLIIGVFKYISLYILACDLLIVSLGMSLLNSIWDLRHVFPRVLLLLFLLIYPAEFDTLTLQNIISRLFNL